MKEKIGRNKKLTVRIDTGYYGATIEHEIEVPFEASEEDIQKEAVEVIAGNLEWTWRHIDERTVRIVVNTGFAGISIEHDFEVTPNMTEDKIGEEAFDVIMGNLEYTWTENKERKNKHV